MPRAAYTNLVDLLRARAEKDPDGTALVFDEGEFGRSSLTYGELDARVRAAAAHLQASDVRPGDRALLLYAPGSEYVTGFLGCLYAGVTAVPVFPPREMKHFDRILAIAEDADAAVALTQTPILADVRARFTTVERAQYLRWETTDGLDADLAADWREVSPAPDALAFLQYTSGSTAAPKGVMVGHDNLLHNSAVIADVLQVGEDTRGVSWLPPYHDMGLIGGIIQPLFSGFPCLLMSPLAFLHRPYDWLRAISEFRGTSSAAPDFAYAECLRQVTDEELERLDLTCWRNALVGAEPVRRATLDAFAERFGPAGFRRSAFLPCYGLAEATLLVTGTKIAKDPVVRVLDREELAQGRVAEDANGAEYVGCGGAGGDQVVVADPFTRRECPAGAVGEVWVSGPSIAHGYWADEEQTRQTFQARLVGDRDRTWLRTGDLGFLDGGELYITGRLKELIVIRGANHYPQDIEATAERAHAGLIPGRAAAFAVDDGTRESLVLVHEAAPDADADAAIAAVRAAVSAVHGLAVAEVVLVERGGIPRTSSGKIRRRECRERYLKGVLPVRARSGDQAATPPDRTVAEDAPELVAKVRTLAATVLERDTVAVDPARPLVEQGLDSLRAARLRAGLLAELGIAVDLPDLLRTASVTGLAGEAIAGAASPIPRYDDAASVPASPGQERLWLLDELGAGPAYHVVGVAWLPAAPDVAAVRTSLRVLAERHESLRTGIRPTADGVLEQVVSEAADIETPVGEAADRAACEAAIREWAARPFDLAEPPLLRAAVFHGGPDWALALCVHHIVVDGWSFEVLAEEFGEIYAAVTTGRAPDLAERPIRYRDFALWQRERQNGPAFAEALAFWRTTLAGAAPAELRGDRREPTAGAFEGDAVPLTLPGPLVTRLRQMAAEERATLFMALVAGFAAVLGRWSGRRDVLLGTVSAERDRPELTGLVGFLAGTLPLRVGLDGDPAFHDLLRRARDVCLDAFAHQEVPFERMVQEARTDRDVTDHRPLVRHALVLQEKRPRLTLGRHEAEVVRLHCGARFDLEIELVPETDGGLTGTIIYATDVFDRATVRRFAEAFGCLLEEAADRPDLPVSSLAVMDDAMAERLVSVFSGAAARPVTGPSVPRWFEAQVEATPDAPAVVDPDGSVVGYRELDGRADALAHLLRGRGADVERPVAVCLRRGVDLSVAMLAIMKAGAVYLPLDPAYPDDRLRYLISDSRPALVVTTPELADRLGVDTDQAVLLDTGETPPAVAGPPELELPADAAAYILYTSGSTGRPKGAVNTSAGLVNRLRWAQGHHPVRPGDRVLQKTPTGFDVSVWELLLPLVSGATLVYARPDGHRDPAYVYEVLAAERVTVCHFVPSMLRAFLDAPPRDLPDLRCVICSGEELPASLAREFVARFPGVELHNLYGPTEAAIDVTAQRVTAPVPPRVPIGRPVHGASLYVLDEAYRPQPIGVPGQLFIGGVQVARGYHGRPGLTAERFVPHPFVRGERLYATGDLARWSDDGTLEHLGRLDHQVKIRGNRVEPGEIEATLLAHPRVDAAVVTDQRNPGGEMFLAAYVVTPDDGPEPAELRAFVGQRLPAYMVPAVFVRLDAMPLLPNGKIDRSGLPRATFSGDAGTYVAPRTPVEQALAGIWSEVLGVERVGVRHDFFELGGHSLVAVRVISRVRARLGVDIGVADLLTAEPTIERLAGVVEERQIEQATADDLRAVLGMLDELSDEDARRLIEHDEPR